MYLDLNPGTIGLGQRSLDELIQLATQHGFEGIDLPLHEIRTRRDAEAAARRIEGAGLKWGLFPLPCDFLQADDARFEHGIEQLEQIAPLVQAAGCQRAYNHVWPGSDERPFEANWAWHLERLKRLVDLLGTHGIRLGIEFIGPKTLRDTFAHPFIYTLPQALELADAVSPELGIVLDTFHWYTSGGTLEELREYLTGDRVINVHANDAIPHRPREEQQDMERAMPLATGVIDAPGVLRVLRDLDYGGPVIAEPFMPEVKRLRTLAPEQAVQEVAECMHALDQRMLRSYREHPAFSQKCQPVPPRK